MSALPPLNSTDDLRRLALNAGTYGMVTIPARALLDLLGDTDPGDAPSVADLKELICEAERAAWTAEEASNALSAAANDLRKAHDSVSPPSPRPRAVLKEQSR